MVRSTSPTTTTPTNKKVKKKRNSQPTPKTPTAAATTNQPWIPNLQMDMDTWMENNFDIFLCNKFTTTNSQLEYRLLPLNLAHLTNERS